MTFPSLNNWFSLDWAWNPGVLIYSQCSLVPDCSSTYLASFFRGVLREKKTSKSQNTQNLLAALPLCPAAQNFTTLHLIQRESDKTVSKICSSPGILFSSSILCFSLLRVKLSCPQLCEAKSVWGKLGHLSKEQPED